MVACHFNTCELSQGFCGTPLPLFDIANINGDLGITRDA
jgi:hypothetical protein